MLIDFPSYRPGLRRHRTGCYEVDSPGIHAPSLMSSDEWFRTLHEWNEFQGSTTERLQHFMQWTDSGKHFPEYGSCDSIEQFLAHPYGKNVQEDKRSLLVIFRHFDKKNETEGGYRFHKNGEYIGCLRKGFEYLIDEPDMTGLYQFHVYRRRY